MTQPHPITIFGATGFIGRHLVRRLAKTGATILAPTREPDKALFLKPMGDVGQIVPMSCDIRSDASVANAVYGAKTVINLVGVLYETRRNSFQSMHVEAPARMARLAKEAGVSRFIQMSALGASENSKSKYARSKAAGESAVHAFFPDATILRPSIVFGPEDNFFNRFASLARIAPALPLIGGGATKFQPVYVGDVGDAIMKCLESKATVGKIFELGGPQVYSFRQLMELMMQITGRKTCLVNVPWGIATLQAAFLGMLPNPLLTSDQVELLKQDNVLNPRKDGLAALGVAPTAAEVILPTYLRRFGKAGG
jgi:NADH dehydrogenase